MQLTIAVDLSKSVFQVSESIRPGRLKRSKRLTRGQFQRYIDGCPPASRFVLEACGSSHHWGRELLARGHEVKLLPPHQTRGYRTTRNKTDHTDTLALLEAVRNEAIRPVPVKTQDQQCLASLHRLREGYVRTRRSRLTTIRGLLLEYGIAIPVGARQVVPAVHALEPDTIPAPLRVGLMTVAEEIGELDEKLATIEQQLQRIAGETPRIDHLLTVPGIGLITATALAGRVGNFSRFRSSRHFASFLGLTPKEHSSGSRRWLGRINKEGDVYLRTLLIHGARTVQRWAHKKENPNELERWALQVEERRGRNVAMVALANKLARIAWVVATQDRDYQARP